MTVAELIERLQNMPQDSIVVAGWENQEDGEMSIESVGQSIVPGYVVVDL